MNCRKVRVVAGLALQRVLYLHRNDDGGEVRQLRMRFHASAYDRSVDDAIRATAHLVKADGSSDGTALRECRNGETQNERENC